MEYLAVNSSDLDNFLLSLDLNSVKFLKGHYKGRWVSLYNQKHGANLYHYNWQNDEIFKVPPQGWWY